MSHPELPTVRPAYGAETAEMVLNIITTFPELHDQATFEDADNACGTQRCVAGWAYWLHHGHLPYTPRTIDGETFESLQGGVLELAAATYLGLDHEDADWLFYSTENDQAVRALENIVAGKDVDAA